MVTLCAHGTGDSLRSQEPDKMFSRKFLASAYHVHYYTCLDTGWEHFNMLLHLVKQRGGLETIKLQGLIAAIYL